MEVVTYADIESLLNEGKIVDFHPTQTRRADGNTRLIFDLADGNQVMALVFYNQQTNEIFPPLPSPVTTFYQRPSSDSSMIDWTKTNLVFSGRFDFLPEIKKHVGDPEELADVISEDDFAVISEDINRAQNMIEEDSLFKTRQFFQTVELPGHEIGAAYVREWIANDNTRFQIWMTNPDGQLSQPRGAVGGWAFIYSSPTNFLVGGLYDNHAFVFTKDVIFHDPNRLDDATWNYKTFGESEIDLMCDDADKSIEEAVSSIRSIMFDF
jgi:hypothetical protein